MRKIMNLNKNWHFMRHNLSDNASFIPFFRDGFDDSSWDLINVPHDSSITDDFSEKNASGPRGGYPKTTLCYYTKTFNLDKAEIGKNFILEFEGVYMKSTVFINGVELGEYPFGYTTFRYDVSDFVREGENRIAVKVNNEIQPASRWYSGTGIYRPVTLYITEKTFFPKDSLFVTTPQVESDFALVNVAFEIQNNSDKTVHSTAVVSIFDKQKNIVAKGSKTLSVASDYTAKNEISLKVANPKLWCNATPNLYNCEIDLLSNDNVIDNESTKFGVRTFEFTADNGFVINGKKEIIKGVCIHHDNGCLGAAAEKDAFIRKIEAVKAMGANAIRTSHNPEAPEFLSLCDEYGMYVMEEAFDEWTEGKRPRIFGDLFIRQPIFAYAMYFEEYAEKDLAAMVKRDRNHPSILMWSIGNEIEELRRIEGESLTQKLVNVVHKHDLTRPATAGANGLAAINETECLDILDLAGYNYAESFYADDHKRRPNRAIIGSETACMASFEVRGKYEKFLSMGNDKNSVQLEAQADAEHQSIEELSKSYVRARMDRGENSWKMHLDNPFVAGLFIWTGIDYLGEPTPEIWPSISSHFAPIDRALFPKDAFYFYKSIWGDEDVLHILPHWNLEGYEGKEIPVWCFTNCDEVEIFVNGKSYGKQVLDKKNHFHLEWDNVTYEKGEVSAIGFRNGKKITSSIKTTGKVSDFEIDADRKELCDNELVYVKVSLCDENANVVPTANNQVSFECGDNLSLVAIDSGAPSFSKFTETQVNALSGYALGIFRAKNKGSSEVKISIIDDNGQKITKAISVTVK